MLDVWPEYNVLCLTSPVQPCIWQKSNITIKRYRCPDGSDDHHSDHDHFVFSCLGHLNNWHCLSVGRLEPTNYNNYNNYNDYNDFNDYNNYNGYNDYNVYRNSVLDLDLDWERFSDFVTQLTITDKLRNVNHDI